MSYAPLDLSMAAFRHAVSPRLADQLAVAAKVSQLEGL